MLDPSIQKIKRFLGDQEMSKAVYHVLLESFLKPQKDRDVQTLAASRIAIDLLDDAWKELAKYKHLEPKEDAPRTNPGV